MSPPPLSDRKRRIGRTHNVHPAPLRRRLTFSLFAAALIGTLGAAAAGLAAPTPAAAANWSPVHAGDFPDPSVLLWDGVYYAFATQSTAPAGQEINVQVSTSTDGVTWIPTSLDALPQLGSWAEEGDTWAPSVAYDSSDDTFVMYYTAPETSTGDECIGVATSLLPLGPYSDHNSTPVVCQDDSYGPPVIGGNGGGSIDPDIFTDPQTNQPYLIWKNDGNHVGLATSIWSIPLLPTLLPEPDTSPTQLLADASYQWQSGIIEGPDMYYQPGPGTDGAGGAYYLFYSGSDEGASTYGIGWASCSGPMGPCVDQSSNGPLLGSQPGVSGPGGPDVYTLPGGQTVMAFAGWQGTTIGYLECGFRPMYLASLTFGTDGTPSLGPELDTAAAASPTCPLPPPPPPGYWQVGADGGIFSFGGAQFYGSTGSMKLNQPVVGMAATSDGRGYWLVAADGGVFNYGDAGFYGSTGSIKLNKPIIGLIPTLDGRGYWLIASDGGVFAFGDATFYGSTGADDLDSPVTGAAPSYLAGGYWLVDANGQVFNFGDAPHEGQPSSAPGGYRITGLAGTRNSQGYWLASANGNVADEGNAAPYGSEYGTALNAPVVGIAPTTDGAGYWLQGADGGIFTFGDAPFLGSMGGQHLNAPMVGIAAD